jgi:hypothetical protein
MKKIAKTLQAQAADPQLVPGERDDLHWDRRGNEQPVQSDHEKCLRISDLCAIEVALYHTLGKLPICRAYPPIDSADERKKEGRLWPPRTNESTEVLRPGADLLNG